MTIRELEHSEYLSTMVAPMRRLEEPEEMDRPISLKEYLEECIQATHLPTDVDSIEIENVYKSADKRYSHVMFVYGEPNRYLVLVINHDSDSVLGHFLLDLNREYGPNP